MDTWYDFENECLCIEPESQFEMSFLTSLLGKGDSLTCATMLSSIDNSVVGIVIKSRKLLANTEESPLTHEEIDELYEEINNK